MKTAMMKSLLLLELAVAASGFVSPRFPSRAATVVVLRETSSAVASDFGTAMPTEVNPYEKIGIQEHQLALGTNPEDLYQYVGTRDEILARTMEDIPAFSRAQAEVEVDRFLLDAEALRIYIEFQKRKAEDPDFALPKDPEEETNLLSFQNFVVVYLGYVAYATIPVMFRTFVEGQIETGDWHGSGIPFIDEWLANGGGAGAAAVNAAVDIAAVSEQVSATPLPSIVSAAMSAQVVSDTASQMLPSLADLTSSGALF